MQPAPLLPPLPTLCVTIISRSLISFMLLYIAQYIFCFVNCKLQICHGFGLIFLSSLLPFPKEKKYPEKNPEKDSSE